MFEKYFITVQRGKRIEEGCTKLVNILKDAGKPMSVHEIYDKASSIYLTQSMLDTLVRCKALTKEIRAEEIINVPFEATIRKDTLVTNDDGSVSAKIAWGAWRRDKSLKIYNSTVEDEKWMPETYGKLRGFEKVQVRRAYYQWIGD